MVNPPKKWANPDREWDKFGPITIALVTRCMVAIEINKDNRSAQVWPGAGCHLALTPMCENQPLHQRQ